MELVIQNLSKTYPNGIQALKDVNLTIPKGMFGLLGPNGAGKSTLIRTLATMQEADAGSVVLGDASASSEQHIDVLGQKEEVRKYLGYLPQSFGFYPRMKAIELMDHFAALRGIVHAGERKDRVEALLRQVNLWEARKQRLGTFSGGMKQRFGIAQALLVEPRLLIVDEPTAGLDPLERNRFLNLISEVGENVVVILSTHIVEDVSSLCTCMAIINKGKILVSGEPQALIDQLQGYIWKKTVDKAELHEIESEYEVVSSQLVSGKTLIHVYAASRPDLSFEQIEASLADVYFHYIKSKGCLADV